jgi:hypothetical protein
LVEIRRGKSTGISWKARNPRNFKISQALQEENLVSSPIISRRFSADQSGMAPNANMA